MVESWAERWYYLENTISTVREHQASGDKASTQQRAGEDTRTCPILLRLLTGLFWGTWRTCVDWRTKRPVLSRAAAHFSVVALGTAAMVLGGVSLDPLQWASGTDSTRYAANTAISGIAQRPESVQAADRVVDSPSIGAGGTVVRMAVPHTTFPDRPRERVLSYVVQQNDTIFDIAARFNLLPETVVWSNGEALQNVPWLIQPGLELFILPTDGVYHTVRAGETVPSIAADYGADALAILNEWNNLEEGAQPQEGALIVVPGGRGEEVVWQAPQPSYAIAGASSLSWGVCQGITFDGPGATGAFIYPTGSPRVSGWYFHDRRNPTHIGLDYACHLGDPIYAADNGTVSIAGWNGGYGILVEVNHGNSFVTRYAHFDDVAGIVVGCGQPVYQGQLLGYCGSTGWSSGPHLHFEVRYQAIPQDPQAYLP
jgi:hypothetical protein